MAKRKMAAKPDARCIFCKAGFSEDSEEHVILSSLGGKLSRSRMTCGPCNGHAGNGIDSAFVKAVEWVTTIVNPKGRRRRAGALKNLRSLEGDVLRIEPGGTIVVEHRQIGDGRWVGDADQSERLTSRAADAARAKSERMHASVSTTTEFGEILNPTFDFRIELDGHVAFRSAVKSALEGLSVAVANGGFIPDESLDPWRDYVRHGSAAFHGDVGYLVEPAFADLFHGLEHFVMLVQHGDGSIYFEVGTYGGILAISGTLPQIAQRFPPWLYRVDPVTGHHSRSHPSILPPSGLNWSLNPSDLHHERMMAAIGRLTTLWQKRGDERNIGRMFDQVWTDVMNEPGKPITERHVREFSVKFAERFVTFLRKTKRLGQI